MEKIGEVIAPAIEAVRSGRASYGPTEKGCQFCKVKESAGGCKAFEDAALAKIDAMFNDETGALVIPHKSEVADFDTGRLASMLEGKGLIEQLLKSVTSRAEELLKGGTPVPGFKLIRGRANRKWGFGSEEEQLEFMTKELRLKKTLCYTQKILSPAQAEKLVDPNARNGKKKWEALQAKIVKPEGALQVAHESHKAPAVDPMFKDETIIDPLS